MPNAFDEVDQFVIVMLENRSFDHLLGYLRLQPWSQGRQPVATFPSAYSCQTYGSQVRRPFPIGIDSSHPDLPHGRREVWKQLAQRNGAFAMDGFVRAAYAQGENIPTHPACMGYMRPSCIPMTQYLASEFCVCDHWFTPIPTSTHPNRMMAVAGWSPYDTTVGQLTDVSCVLDFLSKHQVSWRVYARRASMFALITPWTVEALRGSDRFPAWPRFEEEWNAPVDTPRVWFIEPGYADIPWGDYPPEDDHPPLTCAPGQNFLREVYRIVRGNDQRWKRTLLVILYDEHGGFFDHMPPLPIRTRAPQVPHAGGSVWPDFPCTGPRVPAFLVSPWVDAGTTATAPFDHTSLLKTLVEKFAPHDRNYFVNSSGEEVVFSRPVSTISAELTRTSPREVPLGLPHAIAAPPTPAIPDSEMRRAFRIARATGGT